MTYVTLTDTGKFDTAQAYQSSAQVTAEDKAYGSAGTKGTALNLPVDKISVQEDLLLSDQPAPQKKLGDSATSRFISGEVDKTGRTYNLWTIEGNFDVSDTDQMKDYGRLMHMCATKGYKEMRFTSGQAITTFPAKIITYSKYGEREYDAEATKVVGDAATPLNVRIKSKNFSQLMNKGNVMSFKITLLETS